MQIQTQIQFQCGDGIGVRRSAVRLDYGSASAELAEAMNSQRGVLLASSFEYPGRYTRWDIGFVNPPIQLIGRQRQLRIEALNRRGEILLPEFARVLKDVQSIASMTSRSEAIEFEVVEPGEDLPEEQRSRRPSVFSIMRELIAGFSVRNDPYLGFYGAFGYDLTFQFEDIKRFQQRAAGQRDLVLYFPDQIMVADHRSKEAIRYDYDFNCKGWDSNQRTETTGGFRRSGEKVAYTPSISVPRSGDHAPGEFAAQVRRAHEHFRRGDLFEVVPGQTFYEPCTDQPGAVFRRLQSSNPAPYGALMNLGEQEYLIAASPEMFVRVEGRQIETCPISGTIRRGTDAIDDAEQIRTLLNSAKDESELSMCTDVDRNDKARVCETGSVRVVGRRQIEMYSRLIHTVDHVKGTLRADFDALDGFLAHTWAVTVTGAPKLAAMQFIEKHEKSPRLWYGGALGYLGCNGDMNTGLTLRTIRLKEGVAEIRAGATLLIDSEPEAEEAETRLKAAALIAAVRGEQGARERVDEIEQTPATEKPGLGSMALMVDHQDSFVHNLAAYFRATGMEVLTLRPGPARRYLQQHPVDLLILSPGPGKPADFAMAETIELALQKNVPVFGVCLGLQGLVEYFGGSLAQLDYPMHGKSSRIRHEQTALFEGIDQEFRAGRYHSLVTEKIPGPLRVTARSEDGAVMAIEHRDLPVMAVQFHPESILTLRDSAGQTLINNAVAQHLGRGQREVRGRQRSG
ncbi:MAG: anthranilate synthase component I [Pseudomonadales bacterium]|nr:anthranilate synthase component I [Pseudomonadales bacterium]